jgi:hypothetical protein
VLVGVHAPLASNQVAPARLIVSRCRSLRDRRPVDTVVIVVATEIVTIRIAITTDFSVSTPVRLLLEAEAAQIAASSITAGELAQARPDPARLARSEVTGKAGHRRRQPEIPLYHLNGARACRC